MKKTHISNIVLILIVTFVFSFGFYNQTQAQTVNDNFFFVSTNLSLQDINNSSYYYNYNWSYSSNNTNWTAGASFNNSLINKVESQYGTKYANVIRNNNWPVSLFDETSCNNAVSDPNVFSPFLCKSIENFTGYTISGYPNPTASFSYDLGDGLILKYRLAN